MEAPVLEKKPSSKKQLDLILTDDFLVSRLTILVAASFAMLGYAHLLPTLLADLFYDLEANSKLLGRYSFASMLFLQVVYVFVVKPEISGREKGPKGDTIYLLCYMGLSLLPFATVWMFGVLQPFLILFEWLFAYFSSALFSNHFACLNFLRNLSTLAFEGLL